MEVTSGSEVKMCCFVGDILQLPPPVNGTPVFRNVPSKIISMRIGSSNIWESAVVYDELTTNERQKSDVVFADVLDGVSKEGLHLLQERLFLQTRS